MLLVVTACKYGAMTRVLDCAKAEVMTAVNMRNEKGNALLMVYLI
jgi:hypothetical protein